jgi:hypothetical protein
MFRKVLICLTSKTSALEVLLTDLSARLLSGTQWKWLVFLRSIARPCTLHTIRYFRADLKFLERSIIFVRKMMDIQIASIFSIGSGTALVLRALSSMLRWWSGAQLGGTYESFHSFPRWWQLECLHKFLSVRKGSKISIRFGSCKVVPCRHSTANVHHDGNDASRSHIVCTTRE